MGRLDSIENELEISFFRISKNVRVEGAKQLSYLRFI